MVCDVGPGFKRRHDPCRDQWATFIEETGAHARREAYVAELSAASEAWLDVWGFGAPDVQDILGDITVRYPAGVRYQPQASQTRGHAAARAEEEKQITYPPAAGRAVIGLAAETWGRWGNAAEALLVTLAGAAARHDHRRGRVPGPRLQRWRAQLDACLQRAVVHTMFSSRFGLAGRPLQRQQKEVPAQTCEAMQPIWATADDDVVVPGLAPH
jgi:hypothetical protein